jgi:hypothetical protein
MNMKEITGFMNSMDIVDIMDIIDITNTMKVTDIPDFINMLDIANITDFMKAWASRTSYRHHETSRPSFTKHISQTSEVQYHNSTIVMWAISRR